MRLGQSSQRGVAAVEFALLLPIFLLVVFAIAEFSILFYDKAVITNASREAARAGVVLKSPKPTVAQIQQVALNYAQTYLITFGGTSTTPTVTVPSGAGGNFGTPLTVTVSYTYNPLGLGPLLSPITGPIVLTATTVMSNE
jgi:Flp pilus assembly protein TadG